MCIKTFLSVAFLSLLVKECKPSTNSKLLIVVSSFPDYNTTVVRSAIDSAISWINNSSSILNGDILSYSVVLDSLCNREHTEEILKEQLNKELPAAIIGCGCSNATEAVADIVKTVPVVSYGSPSTKLNNSTLYSSLFRTVPTFATVDDAITKFSLHFNWKQLLLITDEINFYIQDLKATLRQEGIGLTNFTHSDTVLFNTGHRVFILDEYGQNARKVMCRAYQNKIYYPGYAWMILDNFIEDDWFTIQDNNCTFDEIQRVLNYSIIIGTSPYIGKDEVSQYAHDAVVSVALAINKSRGNDRSLIDELSTIISNGSSGKVTLEAISVPEKTSIIFTQLIFSYGDLSLKQVVGLYKEENLVTNYSHQTIWPLGTPSDGIPVIVIETVKAWAFVVAVLMSIGGIIWASVCLVFIFFYRKTKVIRLTSPKLNYLLLFGSFSVFLSVILYSFPNTHREVFDVLCPLQPFLGSILGYDICVTVVTVKMWRIYYIFKGPHPSQRIPKDWQLLIVISILISIDIGFSIVLMVIDIVWFPPMLIHENKADSFDPMTGETRSFFFWDCRYSTYTFSLVAILHNFIVHGIGVMFAYRTRKIKITILNEYKYNLAILVTSIAVTVLTFICVYAIGPNPSVFAFFYSVFVTIGTVLFIALTFVPKMITLKQDPLGENLFMDNIGVDIKDIHNHVQDSVNKSSVKPPSDDQE